MKKINKLILMGILVFTFTTTVNASSITWEDITNEWKNLIAEEEGYTITSDDKSMKITLTDETYTYETEFTHDNDVISLVTTDTSNLTELELVQKSYFDNIMVYYMMDRICMLLDIDQSLITAETTEELAQIGITYEATEVTYSEETENSDINLTAENIKKFEIDLNKFEQATIDLKGTYNENDSTTTIINPTVNLSLEKAETNNLTLSANVDGMPENDTAYCEIYLIPEENTGYPTGESKVVATIDNCQNGKNLITINDLSSNTKYTFQVVLNITTSDGLSDMAVGESYVTFQTTKETTTNNTTTETTTNNTTTETVTNPKTGSSFIFYIIACLITSIISFIFMFKETKKLSKL